MSKLIIKNRYATTPNELLNNENLSLKAKGLFAYLQSKPENWRFSVGRMAGQLKEGKEAITKALKELEDYGILSRKAVRKDDGTWDGYDYILSESPLTENPLTDNSLTEKGVTLSKKDNSKKDNSKKDIISEQGSQINEVLNEFYEINPTLNFGNKTQRKAVEELIKKFGFFNLIAMVQQYRDVMSEVYMPVATTPIAFKNKIGDIKVSIDKLNNNPLITNV